MDARSAQVQQQLRERDAEINRLQREQRVRTDAQIQQKDEEIQQQGTELRERDTQLSRQQRELQTLRVRKWDIELCMCEYMMISLMLGGQRKIVSKSKGYGC